MVFGSSRKKNNTKQRDDVNEKREKIGKVIRENRRKALNGKWVWGECVKEGDREEDRKQIRRQIDQKE